jgi:uncharacterized membrane protein YphA (DoxX/SURF4 family)
LELATSWRRRNQAWQQLWFAPADPRAYAIARIGFATAAFWNLIEYWSIRDQCFGHRGTLGTASVQALNGPHYPSLLYWIDSSTGVALFFLVAMLAAVCLTFGFMTRIAAIVTVVVMVSYSYRAYAVTSANDVLLRVFSLLLAISPIDRAFAFDEHRRRARGQPSPTSVPAYGLILMQLQVFVIYEQTAWFKLDDAFWRRGDLMSYFLMSMYARFPTPQWAHWEGLSAVLTYSTLLIELALPWLLLLRRTRALGLVLGIGMHLTIAVLTKLALFSFSMVGTYAVFLERADIDALLAFGQRMRLRLPKSSASEPVELMQTPLQSEQSRPS